MERDTSLTIGAAHQTAGPARQDPPRRAWRVATDDVRDGDWRRYLRAVARHRTLMLAITGAGTLAGIVASRFLHPAYVAKAILWAQDGGATRDANVAAPLPSTDWMHMVQSQAVLGPVISKLRLYLHPEMPTDSAALTAFNASPQIQPGDYRVTVSADGRSYRLREKSRGEVERGTVGDSLGATLGFSWRPGPDALHPGARVSFRVEAPAESVRLLGEALDVHVDPGAALVRLSLTAPSPARAAQTLNAIAAQAVAVAADLKRAKTEELAKILTAQYLRATDTLAASEDALKNFRTHTADVTGLAVGATGSPATDTADPATVRAFGLRLRLDQIRRDRETLERMQGTASSPDLELNALAVISSVRESPPLQRAMQEITQKEADLRALRYRYRDASAPVAEAQAALDTLTHRSVPALVRDLVADLRTREAAFAPQAAAAARYVRSIPEADLQRSRLARDVSNAADLASEIRHRYDDARLALATSQPDLRIVDAAVPPHRPAAPLGPLVIALALLTSLGAGVLGVTVYDAADSRVRHPEQIVSGMRLPILGAVPRWKAVTGDGAPDVETVESLRGLRLRVLADHGTNAPLQVTVSSPSPGDGKSFLSVNLALSFAYAGFKTLLIDGDIRGGAQHRVFALPRRPGLTDVLAGQATTDAALRPTRYAGLTLLSSGRRMQRAPELLLSRTLRDLIGRLSAKYDVIIVDSPPLAAGVDPLALATVTGKLLLVMRAGVTDLPLAVSKLEALDAMPIHTLGVVLNDVRQQDSFRYYTYDLSAYPEAHEPDAVGDYDGPVGVLGGRS